MGRYVAVRKSIDELSCDSTIGYCYVAEHNGDVLASDAHSIIKKADAVGASERILISGDITVTEEAAFVFAKSALMLQPQE